MGDTYTKKLFVLYLKLRFNWATLSIEGGSSSHKRKNFIFPVYILIVWTCSLAIKSGKMQNGNFYQNVLSINCTGVLYVDG